MEQSGPADALRPFLISVIVGAVVCIGLLLLMSLLLAVRDIPQSVVNPMAVFAVTGGAFAAGFCCTRMKRRGGLAYGALCGGALCLIVMLASLGFGEGGFGILALFKIAFMLLGGMLGGVTGVNIRQKRRK